MIWRWWWARKKMKKTFTHTRARARANAHIQSETRNIWLFSHLHNLDVLNSIHMLIKIMCYIGMIHFTIKLSLINCSHRKLVWTCVVHAWVGIFVFYVCSNWLEMWATGTEKKNDSQSIFLLIFFFVFTHTSSQSHILALQSHHRLHVNDSITVQMNNIRKLVIKYKNVTIFFLNFQHTGICHLNENVDYKITCVTFVKWKRMSKEKTTRKFFFCLSKDAMNWNALVSIYSIWMRERDSHLKTDLFIILNAVTEK